MCKYKSRMCVRGDIQKKITTENINAYALVVQWSSIWMLVIIICIISLKTKAIDFSNNFVQANIKVHPVSIHFCPRGNFGHETVMRIKKSLYGQQEAPILWYEKLVKGLEDRGFNPRSTYTCMFIPDKVIYLLYVNDFLWFAKKQEYINEAIAFFHMDRDKYNQEMTEGKIQTASEFLGIQMTSADYGKVLKTTQDCLINNNLKTCGTEDCKYRITTTAVVALISTDSLCKENNLQYECKYTSVNCMLLYATSN